MIEARDNGESSTVGGDDAATLGCVAGDGVGDVGVGVDDDGEIGARFSPLVEARGLAIGADDGGRD